MRFFEKLLLGSGALALGLIAVPALATPTFPAKVAAELELVEAPPCSLCHEGPTQRGTVITPFGTSLRSRGLVAYDEASLANALLALDGEGTDSDGDGTADIDELRMGDDPNAGEGAEAAIVPEYGCTVSGRGRPDSSGGANAALILLAFVGLARRVSRR